MQTPPQCLYSAVPQHTAFIITSHTRAHTHFAQSLTATCHLFTNTHNHAVSPLNTHIHTLPRLRTHPRSCPPVARSQWGSGCKARWAYCPVQEVFGWVGQGLEWLKQSEAGTDNHHNGWSTSSHPYTPLGWFHIHLCLRRRNVVRSFRLLSDSTLDSFLLKGPFHGKPSFLCLMM